MEAIATKTVFTITLWDNAAIYTTATEGDTVKLYDVKLAVKDGRYLLTARFSDQIQVSLSIFISLLVHNAHRLSRKLSNIVKTFITIHKY